MIDISEKKVVDRSAVASGKIRLKSSTIDLIKKGQIKKGDVVSTARVAGIMAAKHTPDLLPLCHQIPLEKVEVKFDLKSEEIEAICEVKASYKTGVEMEALTCATTALLTVWDMTKYLEKDSTGNYPGTRIFDLHVDMKVKGHA
jgi:cyclic pyranopterin phosphate synthase